MQTDLPTTRRDFLSGATALGVTAGMTGCAAFSGDGTWRPVQPWKGFNLLGLFNFGTRKTDRRIYGHFPESEFEFIRDWGFNFVRLPLDYRFFMAEGDWNRFDERQLAKLDEAVAFGEKHGIHVQICLHRIPGFCINPPKEPRDLFYDEDVQDVACAWWRMFARRYRGIPNERISFNLFNEPPFSLKDQGRYPIVARKLIAAIRSEDPARFVVADGYHCGREPVPELEDLPNVACGIHVYDPREISHYKVPWIKNLKFAEPTIWPPAGVKDGVDYLRQRYYRVWEPALARGCNVTCGEFGVHGLCPHAAALGWVEDNLKLLNEYKMGYAFWNLCGPFGVMDNGRTDAPLEDFHGHKLDRKLLDLLIKYL